MPQSFSELVWTATKKIPRGQVATYQQIARIIRRPQTARAVGNALNQNPYAPVVPCHRVVKSNGMVGGFASGTKKKIDLLKKEGIAIKAGKVVNLKEYLIKL
jgi:O-6-methylguanine DNA methyltransferase